MSMSSRINIQGDMERANAKTLRMSYVPNNQSISVALRIDWQFDRQKASIAHGIVKKVSGSTKAVDVHGLAEPVRPSSPGWKS